jgi:hypothetical protein
MNNTDPTENLEGGGVGRGEEEFKDTKGVIISMHTLDQFQNIIVFSPIALCIRKVNKTAFRTDLVF